MSIFKRLFTIAESEANSLVDKLEAPIKGTEQGIRDLKTNLEDSLRALAQVKAVAMRTKRQAEQIKNEANNYEKKAMELLSKAKSGELENSKAEELATFALKKKNELNKNFQTEMENTTKLDADVFKLEQQVNELKRTIEKWENELKMLKARANVSNVQKNMYKQTAQIDSSGTISLLKRMKEKIEQEEALAEAYKDITDINEDLENEINLTLENTDETINEEIKQLKERLNE